MDKFNKALALIILAHDGQFRKYSSIPYSVHPIRVATHILRKTGNENLAVAALLHDTIEDTSVTYNSIQKQFGTSTADLVLEVTDDIDKKKAAKSRADYWIKSWHAMTANALLLKLYDRYDNICDNPHESYIKDTALALSTFEEQATLMPNNLYTIYTLLCEKVESLLNDSP